MADASTATADQPTVARVHSNPELRTSRIAERPSSVIHAVQPGPNGPCQRRGSAASPSVSASPSVRPACRPVGAGIYFLQVRSGGVLFGSLKTTLVR